MPFRITPPDLRSNCVGPWLRVDLYQGTWNPQTQTFARDNGDPALFGYVCQPAAPRLNPAVLHVERWVLSMGLLEAPDNGKAWELHFVPVSEVPENQITTAIIGPAPSMLGITVALSRFIVEVLNDFVLPRGAQRVRPIGVLQIQTGDYIVIVDRPQLPRVQAGRLWRDYGMDYELWEEEPPEIGPNYKRYLIPAAGSRPVPGEFLMH